MKLTMRALRILMLAATAGLGAGCRTADPVGEFLNVPDRLREARRANQWAEERRDRDKRADLSYVPGLISTFVPHAANNYPSQPKP